MNKCHTFSRYQWLVDVHRESNRAKLLHDSNEHESERDSNRLECVKHVSR